MNRLSREALRCQLTDRPADEAGRRLEKFDATRCPIVGIRYVLRSQYSRRRIPRGRVMPRSYSNWHSANMSRPRSSPVAPGIQCRPRTVPGEPCPGNPRRAEVAARAECVRPTRRRVEDNPRGRAGPWRRREAFARRGRRQRCISAEKSCSTNPCSPANPSRSKPAPASRPTGCVVRRGEAVAEVTATGARTKFGRTADSCAPRMS